MRPPNCKVVLITGASSGIGKACAELLTAEDHIVYGTSRRPSAVPTEYRMLEMDVTQDGSVQRAVERVLAESGNIDVVVNNAGYALAGSIEDTTLEEAQQQLDTNFMGAVRVCKAVLPSMRAQGSGLIINISSLGGAVGLPFQAFYSASKFALEGFTEGLRQEVAPFGIQATVIQPGDVRTPITDNRIQARQSAPGSAYRARFEAALRIIEKEERAGVAPEQAARLVLKLVNHPSVAVRYTVGHLSQRAYTASKSFLPSRMFEKLVMSFYGLSRRP
jgi:NAD(P)-dependent dehydrogenase (short-subunit alcohol dehydrogenase family)